MLKHFKSSDYTYSHHKHEQLSYNKQSLCKETHNNNIMEVISVDRHSINVYNYIIYLDSGIDYNMGATIYNFYTCIYIYYAYAQSIRPIIIPQSRNMPDLNKVVYKFEFYMEVIIQD